MSWVEGPLQVPTFFSFFALVYRKLASKKLHFGSIFLFHSKLMTLAAARAIWHRHSPNDGIQWLLVKPWLWLIGQCTPYCTTASARPPKLPATEVHFFVITASFVWKIAAKRPCYGMYKLKKSSDINLIGVVSLFVCFWPLPMTMDAVLATIVDYGQAMCQNLG